MQLAQYRLSLLDVFYRNLRMFSIYYESVQIEILVNA